MTFGWAKDHDGSEDRKNIQLTVCDTGIGIDSKDIPKLGMPFVQAENSLQRRFEGAGIGLSIVRGLAELQSGRMSITSELGKGTSVTITLPLDMNIKDKADTLEPDSIVTIERTTPMETAHTNKISGNKVA